MGMGKRRVDKRLVEEELLCLFFLAWCVDMDSGRRIGGSGDSNVDGDADAEWEFGDDGFEALVKALVKALAKAQAQAQGPIAPALGRLVRGSELLFDRVGVLSTGVRGRKGIGRGTGRKRVSDDLAGGLVGPFLRTWRLHLLLLLLFLFPFHLRVFLLFLHLLFHLLLHG